MDADPLPRLRDLCVLRVPLAALCPDPANPRTHDESKRTH